MKRNAKFALTALTFVFAGCAYWWSLGPPGYLPPDSAAFIATFAPPPARGSPQERVELDELLAIQSRRTPAEAAAARADRRKDIDQFYDALGVDAAASDSLRPLRSFMTRLEADTSTYVRAAKHRFKRDRPYVVEGRIHPCIDDVADDQSYPSGHSTYAFVTALVLATMVPERREALLARADSFARHRMTCGVHFASDVAAGRAGAKWLVQEFEKDENYRADKSRVTPLLRTALKLPPLPGG